MSDRVKDPALGTVVGISDKLQSVCPAETSIPAISPEALSLGQGFQPLCLCGLSYRDCEGPGRKAGGPVWVGSVGVGGCLPNSCCLTLLTCLGQLQSCEASFFFF